MTTSKSKPISDAELLKAIDTFAAKISAYNDIAAGFEKLAKINPGISTTGHDLSATFYRKLARQDDLVRQQLLEVKQERGL